MPVFSVILITITTTRQWVEEGVIGLVAIGVTVTKVERNAANTTQSERQAHFFLHPQSKVALNAPQ